MNATKYLTTPLAAMTLGTTLVLGAIAPTAAAAPAAIPSALHAAPKAAADIIELDNSSNGSTIEVAAGDQIDVRLHGESGDGITLAWSEPRASNSAVLHRSSGGTSSDGNAWAAFGAQDTGTSQITAFRRCMPTPGAVCPRLVLLWRVTIQVG
ncbi:hypothetical protein ACIGXM_22425 [Kitasatospora sp. NPDC052896]|uniref:hypothetical protein n=1 Tax=Kitasatospora sp. NPDC052896 TaxID=3364061 RepID=UPI0037CBD9B2